MGGRSLWLGLGPQASSRARRADARLDGGTDWAARRSSLAKTRTRAWQHSCHVGQCGCHSFQLAGAARGLASCSCRQGDMRTPPPSSLLLLLTLLLLLLLLLLLSPLVCLDPGIWQGSLLYTFLELVTLLLLSSRKSDCVGVMNERAVCSLRATPKRRQLTAYLRPSLTGSFAATGTRCSLPPAAFMSNYL